MGASSDTKELKRKYWDLIRKVMKVMNFLVSLAMELPGEGMANIMGKSKVQSGM